jgi:D-aminoacyl-tRNA deacylase
MRAVLQRVTRAQVQVAGETVGAIGPGLLVLLGVGQGDDKADARYLADKTAGLRIFEDDKGKMNRSVSEAGGSVLVVSQFTLYGDCRKGRRPGFSAAAPPELANALYLQYVARLRQLGLTVATGVFQAEMAVELVNDGPVTLLLDSGKEF